MGQLVFRSLTHALQAGFTVYDRTADGYIVRRYSPNGSYELAIVRLSQGKAATRASR